MVVSRFKDTASLSTNCRRRLSRTACSIEQAVRAILPITKENKVIKKLIHELCADLATPAAMRAVPILLELAEFDEFCADVDELQQMIQAMDTLWEDEECFFLLGTSRRRNFILNEIIAATSTLQRRLDKITGDTRGHYFPCEDVIDGPGLYHFITVSGQVTQTIIAEDSILAAITFGV